MTEANPSSAGTVGPADPDTVTCGRVLVTGASGFVGRYVVRELVARGYLPVCPVRDASKLRAVLSPEQLTRVSAIEGDLLNPATLETAAAGCAAAIHLVGIILERPRQGVTFERLHVEATRRVVEACGRAGIRRYVHMSALGTRPDAVSTYHRTKWQAEEIVRASKLAWTLFRPSLIHGPDGEFMRMMKFFATSLRQPVMPYFGRGEGRVQPVSVHDVAACFVRALTLPRTIGRTYELGGPERFTWKQLYDVCATAIAGRRRLKVPVPVMAAKLAALTVVPLVPSFLMPYKFDIGQVQMSQEDSVCDLHPAEEAFGIRFRGFREELSFYAGQI